MAKSFKRPRWLAAVHRKLGAAPLVRQWLDHVARDAPRQVEAIKAAIAEQPSLAPQVHEAVERERAARESPARRPAASLMLVHRRDGRSLLSLHEIATATGTTAGVLEVWRTQAPFRGLMLEAADDFARFVCGRLFAARTWAAELGRTIPHLSPIATRQLLHQFAALQIVSDVADQAEVRTRQRPKDRVRWEHVRDAAMQVFFGAVGVPVNKDTLALFETVLAASGADAPRAARQTAGTPRARSRKRTHK